MIASAIAARRGSRRGQLILAGALLFERLHLRPLRVRGALQRALLVCCAVLGLSVFSLAGLARHFVLENEKAWFDPRAPVETLGVSCANPSETPRRSSCAMRQPALRLHP